MCAEKVHINIYGTEYSINSDVDRETTRDIAEYVNKKMVEFEKSCSLNDKLKVAVLSALNIAGELYEYRNRCEKAEKELDELKNKTLALSSRIDVSL